MFISTHPAVATVAVHASVDAITSGAFLNGEDTSDPAASNYQVFYNSSNHPSAVASILNFAANNVNFRPKDDGVITDKDKYAQFLSKISTFPGFSLASSFQESLGLNGDEGQFKEKIEEKYHSSNVGTDVVADAFQKQIPSSLGDTSRKDWIFSLIVITSDQGQGVKVDASSISLTLSQGANGVVKIDAQDATLQQYTFSVLTAVLQVNARRFAEAIPTLSVDKFVDELTTSYSEDTEGLEAWLEGAIDATCQDSSVSTDPFRRQHLYRFSQLRMNY